MSYLEVTSDDHQVWVGTEEREKERADQTVCADHILEVC